MSSFGKVKSSAKVLAFIGENAYIFFVKTDVNRPIPTLASNSKLHLDDTCRSPHDFLPPGPGCPDLRTPGPTGSAGQNDQFLPTGCRQGPNQPLVRGI